MPSPQHRRRYASGGATTMPAATTSGSFRCCGWQTDVPRRWRWPWSRIGWSALAARGFSTSPERDGASARHRACRSRAAAGQEDRARRASGARPLADGPRARSRASGGGVRRPLRAGARAALESDRRRHGGGAAGGRIYRPVDLRAAARGRGGARDCRGSTRIWTSWSGARVAASSTRQRPLQRLTQLVVAHGDEPIGILSHHQVMDAAAFATLDRLLALVQDHPRATLAAAGALFGEGR